MTKLGESGGDDQQRHDEAHRILFDLGLQHQLERMSERDQRFVNNMLANFDTFGGNTMVSPAQVFWLRDLKERYLGW